MTFRKVFSDIRFWIILLFVVRLIGITNPPLEVGHNWRQTTVAMVARNFLEADNNILYPRIDIAGEKTGITGMEFPVLNYLICLVSSLFGYTHWYGRLINLIVSSFGLWFFYLLIRKYRDSKQAFYSTIILAVSIWFPFSRKMMPDTFAMSLVIAAIYYGTNYFESDNRKKRILYLSSFGLFMSLGILSKLPAGYILIIFVFFVFDKRIIFRRKLSFVIVSLIGLLPVVLWYFYWVPYLVEEYGFWHFFMGSSFSQGCTEILNNLPETLKRFYDTPLKFIGFAVFMFGLVMSIIKKEKQLILLFLLCFISFSIIVLKAGFAFYHHNYYIIPFVPVMALVAGYGLAKLEKPKLAIIFLVAIAAEGIGNQIQDFRIKEKELRIVKLEEDLDNVSERDDLIIINSGKYPTPMYFAHRKGWVETNQKIKDARYIDSLKEKGLKYIVILKRTFGTEVKLQQYERLTDNEDYSIYRVNDK